MDHLPVLRHPGRWGIEEQIRIFRIPLKAQDARRSFALLIC